MLLTIGVPHGPDVIRARCHGARSPGACRRGYTGPDNFTYNITILALPFNEVADTATVVIDVTETISTTSTAMTTTSVTTTTTAITGSTTTVPTDPTSTTTPGTPTTAPAGGTLPPTGFLPATR